MVTITSGYGPRTFTLNGKRITNTHKGIDVRSPRGAAVTALFSGTVIRTASGRPNGAPVGGTSNGRPALAATLSGNGVLVELADGSVYVEAHLAPAVGVGDEVQAGETVLGHTDISGQITGPHRHIERWRSTSSSTHFDPTEQIRAAAATPPPAAPAAPTSEEDDMYTDADRARDEAVHARVFGALPGKENGRDAFKGTRVLDNADGQLLRQDIAASTARTVAETSAAFHQLVGIIGQTATGQIDVAALAAALKPALGDALANELADRLKS